jgi:PAS domain S-box-containing protein
VWSNALEDRAPFELEHRVRRHDGEYRICAVRGVPVLEADGRIREWIGTETDVTDHRHAQEEREFLGHASQILASSLAYDATLETVARLAVSGIADWCGVDLLEDGAVRRVAVAHADPAMESIATELRRYPFDPDAPGGSPLVIRTGEPALYPEIPDALIDSAARDPEHRELIRTLGMRSAMIVPLIAGGRTLGAVSLVSAVSGRRYGPRDLELAKELAQRAAIAVDHARLFRQTENARDALEHLTVEMDLQMEELQNQAAQLEESQAELEMSNDDLQRANAEVIASETHYHRLVETSPYGVYVVSADGAFTEVNPAAGRIFGRSPEEILGIHFGEVIAPEALEVADDAFARAISGQDRHFEVELRAERPSGEKRLVNVVMTAIREDGRISGIHGVFRDITEERRTQDALRESEVSYRVLFDSLAELVLVLDGGGRTLNVNEAVVQRYGYSRDEILGRGLDLLMDPERTEPDVVDALFRSAREAVPQQFEIWGRTRTGESFPNEMTLTRGRYFGQEVVIAVARDITERKQAEKEVQESERRSRTLLQAIPDLIFRHNRAGEYVDFEAPGGTSDLFVPPEQIRGRNLHDVLPPDVAEAVMTHTERVLASGGVERFDYTLPMPGGRRSFEARLVQSGPDEVLSIVRNVTEQKRSEEREKELLREQAIRAQAEAANRAKSEFLSRMSHELRTPLNAVLGFGQLLEMEMVDEENLESVEQVLKAGRHLLALVDEVLDIARIEAGQMSLSVEPVSVRRVLREGVDLVRLAAARQGIELRAQDALDADHFVRADQQRLKQVLLNLLSNAIKYNRPEGSVTVSCEPAMEDRIRIVVRDTGYGIPGDKLGRLFAPFDRLGVEQSGVEGTGLGLALSKGLVEAMGGTLGVESLEDEGSRFWAELSLASPPEPTDPPEATRFDTRSELAARTHTLLYVEDNLANLRLMERVFQHRPQMKLLTAMQGSLGLELAREHRPDLILLDLNLPDISGDKILLRLREDVALRHIPVVMISGDAVPSHVERMLQLGAQGYLTKPFDIQELLRLVDENLRTAEH